MTPWRTRLLVSGLVLAAAAASAIGAWTLKRPAPVAVTRFTVFPPEKTTFMVGGLVPRSAASAAISPDGRKLAFIAFDSEKSQLWVRPIDALTAQPLPGTDEASFPFWSPDSRFIAYFAKNKLMKIDATGGPPQTLCDARDGRGGAWNRDGVILFGLNQNGPLRRVSSAGGVPTLVGKVEAGQTDHRFPSLSS